MAHLACHRPPYLPPAVFDCHAFVHYLTGQRHIPGGVLVQDWIIADRDMRTDSPAGVCVAMGYASAGAIRHPDSFAPIKSVMHMALYIGHGYYLSKLGLGGLIVSRFEPMNQGFEFSAAWNLLPKRPLVW